MLQIKRLLLAAALLLSTGQTGIGHHAVTTKPLGPVVADGSSPLPPPVPLAIPDGSRASLRISA